MFISCTVAHCVLLFMVILPLCSCIWERQRHVARNYDSLLARVHMAVSAIDTRTEAIEELRRGLGKVINGEHEALINLNRLDEKYAGFWKEYEAEKEKAMAMGLSLQGLVEGYSEGVISKVDELERDIDMYRKGMAFRAGVENAGEYAIYKEMLREAIDDVISGVLNAEKDLQKIKLAFASEGLRDIINNGGYVDAARNTYAAAYRIFSDMLDKIKERLDVLTIKNGYEPSEDTQILKESIKLNRKWIEDSFVKNGPREQFNVLSQIEKLKGVFPVIELCQRATREYLTELRELEKIFNKIIPNNAEDTKVTAFRMRNMFFTRLRKANRKYRLVLGEKTNALLVEYAQIVREIIQGYS